MILVTGANGTNGRHIVQQLAGKGLKVRAMVRDLKKAASLTAPNVEVAKGDFDDPVSLTALVTGIEKAFLLTATSPHRVTQEANFLEAAKQTGIQHIVRLSIVGADSNSPSRLLRRHGQAEQQLADSGIPFTLLRPNYFMQNLLWYAEDIRTRGVFLASLPEATQHSHVDARDIAALAVVALTETGHEHQTYHITGPEALTYGEMMQRLSRLLGRPVRYEASPETYANSLRNWGLDANEILELDAYIARGVGNGAAVTDTVLRVTQRQPIQFEQFARDHLHAFMGH